MVLTTSIFIIHRFCIYKFIYLLKCICNSKINTHSACAVTCGHIRSGGNLSCLSCACCQLRLTKMMLCFLVSALVLETNVLSVVYLAPHFAFPCCLLGISLFKMAPKCSTEVLSSVLKHKKLIIIVPYRENMGAR